jgi:TP901 family phage tail tape measure protein
MATAATIWVQLMLNAQGFNAGLSSAALAGQSFSSRMKAIGGNLSMLGGMMTMGLTVPIVAAGAASLKFAKDFDVQMRNIQSISGQTDEEIAALGQTFLDMSTNINMTTDTPEALARAFYYIQSSGFAGADGMEVLRVSTKAATAGLTDTDTAAKAILATLNAYGLESSDASHVSDVLFKTVDLGVLTFEELATQLGDVVNTAATTGVSIEEVGGAMTVLTRKGVSASESVTAINQLLLQFISPSKKMKDAAADLGVDLSLTALRTKGLQGALADIERIGGPDAMLTIFGDNVRALKAALALSGDGTEEYADIMVQMGDVAGRTGEAFETQTKSLDAHWKSLRNNAMALGIVLVARLTPALITFLDIISRVLNAFRDAPPWIQNAIMFFLLFLAVLGPIIFFLGQVALALGALTGLGVTMSSIGAFFTAVGTVISSLVTVIMTVAIPAILAFLAANSWWIIPLLLVIATVFLVYLAFKNNFGGITEAAINLWGIIKWAFDNIKRAIGELIGKLIELARIFLQIKLPDALMPGSPTPFEVGLRGIGDAMSELSMKRLPNLQTGLNLIPNVMDKVNAPSFATQTESAGVGGRQAINITINNPKTETSEESIKKNLKSLNYTGVIKT